MRYDFVNSGNLYENFYRKLTRHFHYFGSFGVTYIPPRKIFPSQISTRFPSSRVSTRCRESELFRQETRARDVLSLAESSALATNQSRRADVMSAYNRTDKPRTRVSWRASCCRKYKNPNFTRSSLTKQGLAHAIVIHYAMFVRTGVCFHDDMVYVDTECLFGFCNILADTRLVKVASYDSRNKSETLPAYVTISCIHTERTRISNHTSVSFRATE